MNKFFLIIFIFFLSGCIFIPKYDRPSAPVPSRFPQYGKTQSDNSAFASVSEIEWRRFFRDPRLQEIIELALQNNRDLRAAALNVEQIRAQYRIGSAGIFPTINASADATQEYTPAEAASNNKSDNSSKYHVGLDVPSYEIDLFGRLRSLKAQALENYFAAEEARKNVQISLVAEVAIQYLTLLNIDQQLALTQDTLKSVEEYYKLIKTSYEVGNTSELDLRSVEAQMQTARANAADYLRLKDQAQNFLVLLVGEPLPEDLPTQKPLDTKDFLSDLPAGLPSELLTRRPDILEAEHFLKGANANIGAARAAFFPQITLTGFGGTSSIKLKNLFLGQTAWNYSPEITVPIFDSGRNKASLDLANINKSIEIAHYEKAIQTAFREVSDALAARAALKEQNDAQEALIEAQQKRYNLADVRYRNGVDSYLTVLTAQQDLYKAQQSLIQTKFNALSNLVTLYMVLGGGWQKDLSIHH